jgi:hypothetical protein
MATRTVRLDEDSEAILAEVRRATGMAVSEALKQGLRELQRKVRGADQPKPFEIYQEIDLGPGGYAKVPSTESRRGVAESLRKKLGRESSR